MFCLSFIFNCVCSALDLNVLALVQHSKRLDGCQIQMCCLSIIFNFACSALDLNVFALVQHTKRLAVYQMCCHDIIFKCTDSVQSPY